MAESSIISDIGGHLGVNMGVYKIVLTDEQEKFLNLYLHLHPLREGHARADYPGLIANNFINGMMKRWNEFRGVYKDKTGKDWEDK